MPWRALNHSVPTDGSLSAGGAGPYMTRHGVLGATKNAEKLLHCRAADTCECPDGLIALSGLAGRFDAGSDRAKSLPEPGRLLQLRARK